jgi:ankyrin repeat protein
LNKQGITNNQHLSPDFWFDAVHDGDLAIIEHYLDSGWDVNAQKRCTALHLTTKNGHLGIVQLFLDHGADVNPSLQKHIFIENNPFFTLKMPIIRGGKVD